MANYDDQDTETGHRAVVRSGYQPQRQIQTGIGAVMVKIPKEGMTSGAPVTFRYWLIPPYARKTRTLEAFLPRLDLKVCGMNMPKLAVDDGTLGFWSALEEIYPDIFTGAAGCARPRMCVECDSKFGTGESQGGIA